MKKVLVSCGCSQAFGQNLVSRQSRYAAVIGDHFNLDLVDVSVCGASNESIGYQVPIGVNKALELGYEPEEIVVLVGWTALDRMDHFNTHTNRYGSVFVNLEAQHARGDAILHKSNVESARFVRENMWHEGFGFLKQLNAINYAMSYCSMAGVGFVQVLNLPSWQIGMPRGMITNSNLAQHDYTDPLKVVHRKFRRSVAEMFAKKSLFDLTMTNPPKYQIDPQRDTHPSAEGHAMWATKIIHERGVSFE